MILSPMILFQYFFIDSYFLYYINRIPRLFPKQNVFYILCNFGFEFRHGVFAIPSDMIGKYTIFYFHQWTVFVERFLTVNIESGAVDLSVIQCINKTLFVNDSSAGSVYQNCRIFHFCESRRVDNTFCLFINMCGFWYT